MNRIVKWFKGRDIINIITVDKAAGTITYRDPSWQVKPVFAWYDACVGIRIDRELRRVYVFPLPCVGVAIYWG